MGEIIIIMKKKSSQDGEHKVLKKRMKKNCWVTSARVTIRWRIIKYIKKKLFSFS